MFKSISQQSSPETGEMDQNRWTSAAGGFTEQVSDRSDPPELCTEELTSDTDDL